MSFQAGCHNVLLLQQHYLRDPEILLLDEPFGALDAFTRKHFQDVLLDIWQEKRTTMVLVTHDIDESIYLANEIVLLQARPGRIHKILPVNLPFPRNRTSTAFQKLKTKGAFRILENR